MKITVGRLKRIIREELARGRGLREMRGEAGGVDPAATVAKVNDYLDSMGPAGASESQVLMLRSWLEQLQEPGMARVAGADAAAARLEDFLLPDEGR